MAGRAEDNIVHRLATRATAAAWAGALTWAALTVLVAPAPQTTPSGTTLLLMAGALGVSTLAVVALLAVLATAASYVPWPRRDDSDAEPVAMRMVGKHYAIVLGVATAVFVALRPSLVDGWLPPHFTDRPPIVLCVRLVLASSVSFAALGGWFWLIARRPAALPLWLTGVHYVVLRIGAHAAFMRVFDRNLWVLDALGLLLIGASTHGALPSSPTPRARRGLTVVTIAMGLASASAVFGYGRWGAARAQLRRAYPGPADIARTLQGSFDLDGDGFAGSFGGLDCNDDDPQVSPAALELVGNGIDDNCHGGDLRERVAPPAAPRRAAGRARSFVLITIDALRADHVEPTTMPNLAALAERGAWFTRTYAQAPFTDNSIRSMMSGRYPMDFDAGGQFFGQEPSIAELLSAAGYRTHAQKINVLLTPYAFMGFATVDDELSALNGAHDAVTSAQVADKAIAAFDRLDATEAPFMLWVHFFDPHADYVTHADAPFDDADVPGRYRQEVWFTDKHLGRLLDHLEAADFGDRGLLAVTSDHGEALGEHGVTGHARWLYEETLRVPLVLRGVDVVPGEVSTRVRLVDLYPTVLALAAGIDADSDGRSLTELWHNPSGDATPDRDVFARTTYGGNLARAAWVGDDKLIQDLRYGIESLHQLSTDPDELDNRIDEAPDRAQAMRDAVGQRWDRSLNDAGLQRKQAVFPTRQVDPKVWAAFDRAVQRRECDLGKPAACARLAELQSAP